METGGAGGRGGRGGGILLDNSVLGERAGGAGGGANRPAPVNQLDTLFWGGANALLNLTESLIFVHLEIRNSNDTHTHTHISNVFIFPLLGLYLHFQVLQEVSGWGPCRGKREAAEELQAGTWTSREL